MQRCAISTKNFPFSIWYLHLLMHRHPRFNWQSLFCVQVHGEQRRNVKNKWNERETFFRSNKFTQHGQSKSRWRRCIDSDTESRDPEISEYVSYIRIFVFFSLSRLPRSENASTCQVLHIHLFIIVSMAGRNAIPPSIRGSIFLFVSQFSVNIRTFENILIGVECWESELDSWIDTHYFIRVRSYGQDRYISYLLINERVRIASPISIIFCIFAVTLSIFISDSQVVPTHSLFSFTLFGGRMAVVGRIRMFLPKPQMINK